MHIKVYKIGIICIYLIRITYVTLDHKTSHKSHMYICSNSQQYIVWVKIIKHFYAKNH